MMNNKEKYSGLEIAIVGIACKFPSSDNWRAFWQHLVEGKECIHFFSDDELSERNVDSFKRGDAEYVKAGGKINDKEYFDSAFFDYRPHETILLNPIHRLFHECAWAALEDAGINPEQEKGNIGLFAGAGYDLFWRLYSTIANVDQRMGSFMLHFFNNKDYMASLLSYKLNLKGPVSVIDTACSTSLAAVHLACRSLLLGEMRTALAGSASLKSRKVSGYYTVPGGINSADGHCRAFDKEADGTVESEGVGIVVLKKLKDALEDGDHIYALIKGSAMNNDGNRKVGYTAPSVEGQAECIKMAHAFSRIDPNTISYIEAHGTGTRLGDPIEIEALNRAFRNSKGMQCYIGSVKTNIGHTDTTAGIAGLIKTALSLKYKKIPASLNFCEPNPQIMFEEGPFSVITETKDWHKEQDHPLRAGVSSFGIGGTNVHVVLESSPEDLKSDHSDGAQLLTLSAKTISSLLNYQANLGEFLETENAINLADMCFSLQIGRKEFLYGTSIVFDNRQELLTQLHKASAKVHQKTYKEYGFAFLFQQTLATERLNTIQAIYQQNIRFKEILTEGFSILQKITSCKGNVLDYLQRELKENYDFKSRFILEYAFAKMLLEMGLSPDFLIYDAKDRLNKYVAATVGGVFDLEQALNLVLRDSRLNGNPFSKETQEDFRRYFSSLTMQPSKIPLVSNEGSYAINDQQISNIDFWMDEEGAIEAAIRPWQLVDRNLIVLQLGAHQTDGGIGDLSVSNKVVSVSLFHQENKKDPWTLLLTRIGELWEMGVKINWSAFYGGQKRKKLPLPTYSFDKIKYPGEFNISELFKQKGNLLIGKMENIADWFYRFQWKQSNWLHTVSVRSTNKLALVFTGKNLLSEAVFASFIAAGTDCVKVRVGDKFAKKSRNEYEINPSSFKDYATLFQDVSQSFDGKVDRIVHMWNAQTDLNEERDYCKSISYYKILGYDALLEIVKNYTDNYNASKLQLDVVGSHLFSVLGNENLNPASSLLLGPVHVIPFEFSNIQTRYIDVVDDSADSRRALLRELYYDTQDREIAIRGNVRFILGYESVKGEQDKASFRHRGTYMITGANGAMGKLFSNFLAKQYQANLILVGRQDKPMEFVKSLEDQGAQVMYVKSDVCTQESMEAGITEAEQVFGEINGIIHTAGRIDYGGIILRREGGQQEDALPAKVMGTALLTSLFSKKQLDFFVVCSSISSQIPGFGQVAYTAANIYLNTLAEALKPNFPIISINWCALNEIGMAVQSSDLSFQEMEYSLSPKEALEVLSRCIQLKMSNLIVSKLDFGHFIKHYYEKNHVLDDYIDKEMVEGSNASKRPDLSVKYIKPVLETEKLLTKVWSEFFGIETIGLNDDFFDLGGDSLAALQICKRIYASLGVELSLSDIFKNPTVKGLANQVDELKTAKSKERSITI